MQLGVLVLRLCVAEFGLGFGQDRRCFQNLLPRGQSQRCEQSQPPAALQRDEVFLPEANQGDCMQLGL